MHEEGRLEYTVGEMANYLGISTQGLHWYEQKGLIAPEREEVYRKYTSNDLCLLSRMRFYKSAGFSLEEAHELLDEDLDAIAIRMNEKVTESRQRVAVEQARLNIVEERARLIRDFSERAGEFRVVDAGPAYFKLSHTFSVPDGEVSRSNPLKHWMVDMPFVQYASVARIGRSGLIESESVGALLSARHLPFVCPEVRAEIEAGQTEFFEQTRTLYGLFRMSDKPGRGCFKNDQELLRKYPKTNMLIKRPITCRNIGKEVATYWEVWLRTEHEH